MKKIAVIYKSNYGSTKKYAAWIAAELGADLMETDKTKASALQPYDVIIYGGGLYAGSVNGIALLTKNFDSIKSKELYLFTVGSSDVNAPGTPKAIRSGLEQKLPTALWEKLHVYHLRGGMQLSKLSLLHRLMMGIFIKILNKKPESQRSVDEKEMLAAITQDTDFTDQSTIFPLVDAVKANLI